MAKVKVGDHVIFHDSHGVPHDALVTENWGSDTPNPTINLLYVSIDESKKDQYGRQIERPSSVCHGSVNHAWGYYWRLPSEEANPFNPPS